MVVCVSYKTLSTCSYETAFLWRGEKERYVSRYALFAYSKGLVFLLPPPSLLWAPKTSPQPFPPFFISAPSDKQKRKLGGGRIVYHVRLNGKASVTRKGRKKPDGFLCDKTSGKGRDGFEFGQKKTVPVYFTFIVPSWLQSYEWYKAISRMPPKPELQLPGILAPKCFGKKRLHPSRLFPINKSFFLMIDSLFF